MQWRETLLHGPATGAGAVSVSATWTPANTQNINLGLILISPSASVAFAVAPSSLTFADPASAAQTFTLSGGTSPYAGSSNNTAIATVSVTGSTATVTPHAAGTCTITATDSATGSLPVAITVGAALSLSPTSLTFADPASATQTSAISGGRAAFTPSSSNTAVATAFVTGATVTVLPHGGGSATITITDADDETAGISITITPAVAPTKPGPTDYRVIVWDPQMGVCLTSDAVSAGDFAGMGLIKYEDTPAGCAAASFVLGLRWEEAFARGYWSAMNICEVSTADMTMTTASAAGASKIYVDSNAPVDPAAGEDGQVLYFWDGAAYTARIPVTGLGTDAGGAYITIGTPDTRVPGNPSVLPAYAAGTYVGRRRYTGRIKRRDRINTRQPHTAITLTGLVDALQFAVGTFTLAAIDIGTAIYDCISQFNSRWPYLTVNVAHFPVIGQAYT
ncbi:MAG: hypothetical protein ACREM8_11515, partial [Vulcanimicrobiaceae bacterium]